MGLFSFIGKAIGTVAKVGLGIATGNVGGAVAAAASGLGILGGSKQPLSGTAIKLATLGKFGAEILRGNATQSMPGGMRVAGIAGTKTIGTNARILRSSPVLPGGAVATRSGPVAASGAIPPVRYGGSSKRAKRRSSSTARKSRRSSGKKSSGRRLKFGSPAWRKKYMKKSRRR